MLGLGFLFGGVNRIEQYYSKRAAQMFGTMLLLSMTSLIIPTVAKLLVGVGDTGVLPISRGISVILLCIYVVFLYFQLETHAKLFSDTSRKASKRIGGPKAGETKMQLAQLGWLATPVGAKVPRPNEIDDPDRHTRMRQRVSKQPPAGETARQLSEIRLTASAVAGEADQYLGVKSPRAKLHDSHNLLQAGKKLFQKPEPRDVGQQLAKMGGRLTTVAGEAELSAVIEDPRAKIPQIPRESIVLCLVACTTLLAFNTTFATDSLDGLIESTGLSKTFIGIVLLPLLSNDLAVLKPAINDQMDLCVLLTVGKCVQTSLFVIPFTVLVGWIIGVDLALSFDGFEVAALFASVLYIVSIISGGKSN